MEQKDPQIKSDQPQQKAPGDSLQKALEEQKAQSQQYFDQLLRLKAEFENFRKRTDREKEQIFQRAKLSAWLSVLHFHDLIEQALRQAQHHSNSKSLTDGLRLCYQEFLRRLAEEGVEKMEVMGRSFDPAHHEAVERLYTPQHPEGTILEEVQCGFTFRGELVRPARVKIASILPEK
ncbi:MAG: nucleotide exchange factor GrpE [Elusimicrobia bacterium]|nr:nucleotide exchange factor GrpE [Elusimicrobiota bacterium]